MVIPLSYIWINSVQTKSCNKVYVRENKHTESIAKAIQVPHRPQQIEICNHYFGALFDKEHLELLRPLIVFFFSLFDVSNFIWKLATNFHSNFHSYIRKDSREKSGKRFLSKGQ